MAVTELGIVTEVRLMQFLKLPMVATELEIVTDVKLLQFSKVLPSNKVTESGIVTDKRLIQSWKEEFLIAVIVFGILTV